MDRDSCPTLTGAGVRVTAHQASTPCLRRGPRYASTFWRKLPETRADPSRSGFRTIIGHLQDRQENVGRDLHALEIARIVRTYLLRETLR